MVSKSPFPWFWNHLVHGFEIILHSWFWNHPFSMISKSPFPWFWNYPLFMVLKLSFIHGLEIILFSMVSKSPFPWFWNCPFFIVLKYSFFPCKIGILSFNPYLANTFYPEIVVCLLHLLHMFIFKCTLDQFLSMKANTMGPDHKKTVWSGCTYCLQYRLPKREQIYTNKICDWQEKN